VTDETSGEPPPPAFPGPDVPSSPGSTAPLATGPTETPRRPLGRGRLALLTLLVIVSCVALVVSTTIAWTHQTVLSSDRYVTIVGRISSEPVVIERVSLRLARQAVLAADVEGRIAAVLPDPADFIATTIADQIEAALATRLAELFASPGFQSAWLEANRALHEQVVAFLRGETSVIQAEDGGNPAAR
jgi:hypothetical protein